jgi:hypothetical protein
MAVGVLPLAGGRRTLRRAFAPDQGTVELFGWPYQPFVIQRGQWHGTAATAVLPLKVEAILAAALAAHVFGGRSLVLLC